MSISISSDPWINGLYGFKSRVNFLSDNTTKVATLISNLDTWDELVVKQTFPPFETEAILYVSLNRSGCADVRFWMGCSNWIYSVKTGYLMEVDGLSPPQFQSSHPNQSWWKLLWKLDIPPRVRIFLWRASKDLISTAANLLMKHVPTNGMCPLCKFGVATTPHCLIFCTTIKPIWKNSIFWPHLRKLQCSSFLECGLLLASALKFKDLNLFAFMACAVWIEFCKLSHEPNIQCRSIKIDWVFSCRDLFQTVSRVGNISLPLSSCHSDLLWTTPIIDHFRVDVDAAFNMDRNSFSVGAVIRDHDGRVVGAKACVIRNPGSVKSAELIAIRFGLDFCFQRRLSCVCLFSDSLQTVKTVIQPEEDLGPNGAIVLEIQEMLRKPQIISINHMRRLANETAHILAQNVLISATDIEWSSSDIPSWLSVVHKDLSSLSN